MAESVFRTANTEPAEEQGSPAVTGKIESSAPVSVPELLVSYEEDQGKPYIAEYFEMDKMWDKEPSLARDIREIDGFLKEMVEKGELSNSTKAATQYIKELERKAGLSRYESVNTRISKLLAYIDFKRFVNA